MSVRSLQYFKKFGAVNQKTAKFAIFCFGSLSVAYHAYEDVRLLSAASPFDFRRTKKIFSEICKKTLDIPVSVCYTQGE